MEKFKKIINQCPNYGWGCYEHFFSSISDALNIRYINICKNNGTFPFANIARCAFISMNFLNSMVEDNILTKNEKSKVLKNPQKKRGGDLKLFV